jgi:ATP-dependent Clp protease protease subunit
MDFTINNNTITAYGTINDGDGMLFSNQFNQVANSHKTIIVKLHTYGGSVFDGNLIYNTLINSTADIEIHIVGIAASMGAVISLATDKVFMVENGYIMIHTPSGGTYGTATDHENNIKLLRSIEANFIKKLSEKTAKDEDYVNKWLVGDNWFDANQALQEGLIAGILTAETKVKGTFDPKQLGAKEVYSRFSALMSNKLNNDNMDFKKELIKKYNLKSNASDTAILNAIQEQEQETNAFFDSLVTMLNLDVKATEDDVLKAVEALIELADDTENDKKIEANFLISDALRKGKIVHGQKDFITNMFKTNFAGAKAFLNNAPERVSITSQIRNVSNQEQAKGTLPKSEWGIDEYRKFAPNELANDPELYQKLVKNKYKK